MIVIIEKVLYDDRFGFDDQSFISTTPTSTTYYNKMSFYY